MNGARKCRKIMGRDAESLKTNDAFFVSSGLSATISDVKQRNFQSSCLSWMALHSEFVGSLGVFAVAFLLLCMLYVLRGIAPFGDYSLAWGDAENQYLDFFAYYQDVLYGNNSLEYTLSSYLGGNTFGLFAYYLASPFSLLVALFPKDQLLIFFDLVVALKLALASATMYYFLTKRFDVNEPNSGRVLLCVLLGLSYGFSQWMFSQASNILWLDAAYLTPIIMLGVYRGVWRNEWAVFSIAVALNIMFNWYMGAICGLFSIFYFAFEVSLFWKDGVAVTQSPILGLCKLIGCYAVWGIVAIALSAVIFLPSIASMVGSSRSDLEVSLLTNISFMRELPNLIVNYTPGSLSTNSACSLYAGGLVILGIIGSFFDRKNTIQKIVALVFLTLMVCWSPLVGLFSLMKPANSFFVRYAFLAIAGLIMLAGLCLLNKRNEVTTLRVRKITIVYILFICAQLLLKEFIPGLATGYSVLGIVFGFLVLGALYITTFERWQKVGQVFLCLCVVVDLSYNGYALMGVYRVEDVAIYEAYTSTRMQSFKKLVALVNASEEGHTSELSTTSNAYRMNVLSNRTEGIAHQDESLAFGYASVSGYSSVAIEQQVDLLSYLGYPIFKKCAVPIKDELLAADSLLGVQFIGSDEKIAGLDDDDIVLVEENIRVVNKNGSDVGNTNERLVYFYRNPYAFPLAFVVANLESRQEPIYKGNPFVYTNELYEYLLGSDLQLYDELEYSISMDTSGGKTFEEADPKEEMIVTYTVLLKDSGQYINYGNLPWKRNIKGSLTIGEGEAISYGDSWDPTVFLIPDNGASSVKITYKMCKDNIQDPQFYALDLGTLKEASRQADERGAAISNKMIDGGGDYTVEIACDATAHDRLIVSVPYDKHWTVEVNGSNVSVEAVADCLMAIPLENGHNEIVLRYVVDSRVPGLIISFGAALVLVAVQICKYGKLKRLSKRSR